MSWSRVAEIVNEMARRYGMDRRRHPLLRELLELVEQGITMEVSDGSGSTLDPQAQGDVPRGP